MQATIFVQQNAMRTLETIQSLDYYDRVSLSDDPATDLTSAPGYFLNAPSLRIAELPPLAKVAISLSPSRSDAYRQTVTAPEELRGVVYAGAPALPAQYSHIIRYWSPLSVSALHHNAVYYQNLHQAYLVRLAVADGEDPADPYVKHTPVDELLTDGIVFCITGIAAQLEDCDPHDFIEVYLPIDPVILGIEHDGLRSLDEYRFNTAGKWDQIYLRVADIMASPDPNLVAISALRSEFCDYGFVY